MMDGSLLVYIGSFLPVVWGLAHLFPTGNVVRGFGGISIDNKRIITMEWIIEGVTLVFVGTVTALATYVDRHSAVSMTVYWATFSLLNVLSLISLFTGFRVSFIAFRLCPVIFTGSSLLVVVGAHI